MIHTHAQYLSVCIAFLNFMSVPLSVFSGNSGDWKSWRTSCYKWRSWGTTRHKPYLWPSLSVACPAEDLDVSPSKHQISDESVTPYLVHTATKIKRINQPTNSATNRPRCGETGNASKKPKKQATNKSINWLKKTTSNQLANYFKKAKNKLGINELERTGTFNPALIRLRLWTAAACWFGLCSPQPNLSSSDLHVRVQIKNVSGCQELVTKSSQLPVIFGVTSLVSEKHGIHRWHVEISATNGWSQVDPPLGDPP